MFYPKNLLLVNILSLLNFGEVFTEKASSHEISTTSGTSMPIVLQLFQTIQPFDPEIFEVTRHENIEVKEKDFHAISNDIEVFEEKLGPKMAKQEEEPAPEAEAEENAAPEEEEVKEVEAEAEPAAEAEPEAEEPKVEEETPAEPEAEVEAEPEEKPEEEPKAEEEAEPEPKPESEPEPEAQPEVEEPKDETPPETPPEPAEGATDNAEPEMPNDEPAKEEEAPKDTENPSEALPPAVPAPAEDAGETTATKSIDKPEVSCFTCSSNEDLKCHQKPSTQVPCPHLNDGDKGKHNGCYTLYQANTNTTVRGCVDELSEEDLKFCLSKDELCRMCYKNGCNNQMSPSKAVALHFNMTSMLSLNILSLILIQKIKNYSFV